MSTQPNKQQQFHEALTYIVDLANMNQGHITMQEIHQAFDEIISQEEDYQHIYQYLLENKITIDDSYYHHTETSSSSSQAAPASEEDFDNSQSSHSEHHILELYQTDVSQLPQLTSEEMLALLKELITADDAASYEYQKKQQKLIESSLSTVISIASGYQEQDVPMNDLIQEGNLGLMEGITNYISLIKNRGISTEDLHIADFQQYISDCIHRSISQMISEEASSSRLGNRITDHANRLDTASIELSKTYGRVPTVEELASYLSISTDEVENIMKMSLNALNAETAQNG